MPLPVMSSCTTSACLSFSREFLQRGKGPRADRRSGSRRGRRRRSACRWLRRWRAARRFASGSRPWLESTASRWRSRRECPVRIHRRAAPFRAAVEAGEDDRAFAARWEEHGVRPHFDESFEHRLVRFRRDVGDFILGEELRDERRGLASEAAASARRPRRADPTGGTGRSSIGKSGSPVSRLKTKTSPGLRDLRDGVDALSVAADGEQVRRRGQVAVPEVVMHELIVPEALAGGGVEREQAVGEEVLADAVAAPEIEGAPSPWARRRCRVFRRAPCRPSSSRRRCISTRRAARFRCRVRPAAESCGRSRRCGRCGRRRRGCGPEPRVQVPRKPGCPG